MNLLITIISILYAGGGIVVLIGYFPTIKDLLNSKASANTLSYVIWTACSIVSFLYALLVISDLLLEIVVGLNLASCALILILSLRIRNKKR